MNTTKQQKTDALNTWMQLRNVRHEYVLECESRYLDAVEARNNSPLFSKRYEDAVETINTIEQHCTGMMFGACTEQRSWSECVEEVALQQSPWKTTTLFFVAIPGRSRSVEEGTPVFRHKGKWVVLQHVVRGGRASIDCLYCPEHVITTAQ